MTCDSTGARAATGFATAVRHGVTGDGVLVRRLLTWVAMPVLLTKTAVALYVTALVALVATTFYVTPEASSETYLACASDVRDAETSPAPCVGGSVFHDGDVLADLSTSYERVKAVIAWTRFNARYVDFVQTESAQAVEEAEDHVIRAQGMGIVRRIHATRSTRAKTGFFFSIVTEPGQVAQRR